MEVAGHGQVVRIDPAMPAHLKAVLCHGVTGTRYGGRSTSEERPPRDADLLVPGARGREAGAWASDANKERKKEKKESADGGVSAEVLKTSTRTPRERRQDSPQAQGRLCDPTGSGEARKRQRQGCCTYLKGRGAALCLGRAPLHQVEKEWEAKRRSN